MEKVIEKTDTPTALPTLTASHQKINTTIGRILKIYNSPALMSEDTAFNFTKLLELTIQFTNSIPDHDKEDALVYLARAMKSFRDLTREESTRILNFLKNLYCLKDLPLGSGGQLLNLPNASRQASGA